MLDGSQDLAGTHRRGPRGNLPRRLRPRLRRPAAFKRAIQRLVQDPLAMRILEGTVLHGSHVVIDADRKGKLEFRTQGDAAAEAVTA